MNDNGWPEYKREVLGSVERLEKRLDGQDKQLDSIQQTLTELKTDRKWAGWIITGGAGFIAFLTSLAANFLRG